MGKIKDIMELEVFKYAHDFTLDLYKITNFFPKEETFGFISQMRRAAYSICANLMEGSYRNNTKEFRQFCGIARGSCGELKYFIMLSKDLGYIEEDIANKLANKITTISKMIYGIIKTLESKK